MYPSSSNSNLVSAVTSWTSTHVEDDSEVPGARSTLRILNRGVIFSSLSRACRTALGVHLLVSWLPFQYMPVPQVVPELVQQTEQPVVPENVQVRLVLMPVWKH